MRRFASSLVAIVAVSCAESSPPPLRPVVATRIAELEAGIGPRDDAGPADAELEDRVRGLAASLPNASARMREVELEDLRAIGDRAVPVLRVCVSDPGLPDAQRLGALELAGLVDTPAAGELLISVVESGDKGWLRANAAWRLAGSSRDETVPRLLLQLKYETDTDTVIWIAQALARFGNWAGVDGLEAIAAGRYGDQPAVAARERFAAIATEAGVADGAELARLWRSGDPAGRLERREPSTALRLEVWRRIGRLSEQDLRAVDDARFVLSRCSWWVAGPLAEALQDENIYTRTHAAQCLKRMGPRASGAGPSLADALDDPRLAPAAAAALGAIGWSPAVDRLVERLGDDVDPELRIAVAWALGGTGSSSAATALRPLLAKDLPTDLRLAAAASLASLGAGDDVASLLLGWMSSGEADQAAAEAALERWLEERAAVGDERAARALQQWLALQSPVDVAESTAERDRRRSLRAESVRDLLAPAPD